MKLIINADDLGLNISATDAIFEAFDKGLITDTTMLANGGAFEYASEALRKRKSAMPVGIHFNITESVPLTEPIKECARFVTEGRFNLTTVNRPLNQKEKRALFEELCAQVERVKSEGITITHADSHHHSHISPVYMGIFLKVCKKYGIEKIRISRNIGRMSTLKRMLKQVINRWFRFKGMKVTDYFGDVEDAEKFCESHSSGVVEIMVHPDYDIDGRLIDRKKNIDGKPSGDTLECVFNVSNAYPLTEYRML